jgi:hypothetical protein
LGQLATEDFDSGWGNNAERDSIALDFDDFHSDVAIDNQLITNFPTENEHFASSLSVIAAAGAGIVGLSQPNTIIIRLALDNLGQRRIEFKIIACLPAQIQTCSPSDVHAYSVRGGISECTLLLIKPDASDSLKGCCKP